MRNIIIRISILLVLFVASVIVISKIYNRGNTDLTTTMEDTKFPIVYYKFNDQPINYLHGYTNEMKANYMRDSLTLIGEDRQLPVVIENNGTDIKKLSFEVRSLDTTRLVESTQVTDFKVEDGLIKTNLSLKNLLEANTEYILVLNLETKDETIHYYTRVRQETEDELNSMSKLISFVQEFHSWTLEDGKDNEIAKYLETSSAGDNSSFHYVDINSSCSQVTFGNLEVQVLDEPRVSIKEQNATYGVFTIEYTVTLPSTEGDTEYYNVEEYYRVKQASDRIYLLNYNRHMEEIFIGDNHIISDGMLQLGIGDQDIEYKGNEEGTVVCFEKEGELWSYSQEYNKLTKVFGFRSGEGIDIRENWQQHDIKVINVDESGSVDFLVCGYMNRGNHEGEVGIAVYHFDSVSNTIEEEVFIPSTKSYQVMKEEVGDLLYVNEDNELFVVLDGVFYKINLNTREMKVIVQNLQSGCYATSEDGQMIGWLTENKLNSSQELKVMNLNSQAEYTISVEGDEYLRPLGFVGTDLVYGIAKKSDIVSDISGNTVFPMFAINIVNEEKEVVKEYKQDGCYTVSAKIDEKVIELNRVSKGNSLNGYVAIASDQIMNNSEAEEEKITLHTTATDLKETQVQIAMAAEITKETPQILTSKEVLLEESRNIELSDVNKNDTSYFVYAQGKVVLKTDKVSEAIECAQEQVGVVVGEKQQCIWERGNLQTRAQLENYAFNKTYAVNESLGACISLMCEKQGATLDSQKLLSNGETVLSILEKNIKANVLCLSGCSLDEVRYFVSKGNPVLAMTDKEHAVLIVGYDEFNISVLDPVTGTTYKVGLDDGATMFEGAGNVFISYIN